MTPRMRVLTITVAAAGLAALAAVGLAILTADDRGGGKEAPRPRAGVPPLLLDLGVRDDPEGRALRRAGRLYDKRPQAAARIFARYHSPEAEVGGALADWPDDSLERLERLAQDRPRSSFVLLHLGLARFWAGRDPQALTAWRDAARAQPDSPAAERSDDLLHPRFPAGEPHFVPNFALPAGLGRVSPPRQLAALARRARGRDVHAKLLYGLALQRLRRRLSARREYDAAVRLAPSDPEARVAAAVARFDKSRPSAAFALLGPLTRRFPHAQTVRFHLGLLLLWLAQVQPGAVDTGKAQLRQARALAPDSRLGRQAGALLGSLGKHEVSASRTYGPQNESFGL